MHGVQKYSVASFAEWMDARLNCCGCSDGQFSCTLAKKAQETSARISVHVTWGERGSGWREEKLDIGSVPECTRAVGFPQDCSAVMSFYERTLR